MAFTSYHDKQAIPQQYQSGIMHTLPCNLRFKISFYRQPYKIAANITLSFVLFPVSLTTQSVILEFFFALSIFFLHPAIAWQLALKWENSCKNPMSALFYFALYHIFIQSLCHFRMYWTLLLWWRKSWMLGLYTSLAMLYKLAIRVEKVGWFVSELVGGWLNCSEWSSGDILLLLLDTLSRTYFR